MNQITDTVLMIKPVNFHYNAQTAVNNFYQKAPTAHHLEAQQSKALKESRALVKLLKSHGIRPFVVADTLFPETPDSIFPNNWISFHQDGRVALYPMFAPNRRLERREDILALLEADGFKVTELVDYSEREESGCFLEGTGSMVLDRNKRIAYALLSERTDEALFESYCEDLNYQPIAFHATQTFDSEPAAIYRTNVMMTLAEDYAVIALTTIVDLNEREKVISALRESGKTIVTISPEQFKAFAGNMLQLKN